MKQDFKLEDYVDAKINNIQKIIGEDYKILKEDEQINTKDIYAIYREEEGILDKEEVNPLEPSKFEKILQDLKVNKPKFWEEIKLIPDGIRSSDEVESGGTLLLACESGTETSGKIRKYYLINPSKEIKEIGIAQVLEILESDDEMIHSTPSNFGDIITYWRNIYSKIFCNFCIQ